MATVFWDAKGVILLDILPQGQCINAARYSSTLDRLKEAIRRKRPLLLRRGDQGVAPRHTSVSGRFTPTHKHVQQVSPVPAAGFSMTESGLQCPVGAHTDFNDQQGQSCPRRL
ncbi:mariner transposase [Plakobranchus ocellatus]|uniref:Mariner transposase n=1 Tax=Plakobranchus ocellatus TaxID=259542 RepID=A0AAV4AJ34_9GAST|nr:mariner transposase [Plakobranchus ocellatus]